jgi:predicted Fe-Mo cluster-binding NifX family protein
MKICVTSEGNNLESNIDPRFGRCAYFIFIDTDTMVFEAVENSNTQAMGGAGVQSGQLVADKGASAVLTGNVGPNAFRTLQAAGIKIVNGASGTVREAVESFKKGGIKETDGPSVNSKFGINNNSGR